MQTGRRVSLNAVRVFAIVARTGSLTAAGAELGVTSGAVSHQLRNLEEDLGVTLFRRGNNTLTLTEIGQRFFLEIAPAVNLIERSANTLQRDENEISVHATTSLALRWLIPSLDRFHALYPQVRVRVETTPARFLSGAAETDVSIRHFRVGEASDDWEFLADDLRRPVISPGLLARCDTMPDHICPDAAALQCCVDNWDWQLWAKAADIDLGSISFGHAFDTDDAAIHASVAGLGMSLAPTVLTVREMRSGLLVVPAGLAAVEAGTYRYWRRSDSGVIRKFCNWITAEMQKLNEM